MTLRQLAASNVRGGWHRYVAFFLASVFSVLIFFLIAQFIYHPSIINGSIAGALWVRKGLIGCQYIIIIFSALFILYSSSAFLKSRKKEFGLLSLCGMTPWQIKRLVLLENLLISLVSIVSGILAGAMLSRLFFMAISALLQVDNPIPFALVPKAIWQTTLAFLAAYQLVTALSLARIGKEPVVELLRASRKPKRPPVASIWLTLLAAGCLAYGYSLALNLRSDGFGMVVPCLIAVITGTYFLFTQASVGLLRRLQRALPLYYKKTNLITFSQLAFKMKDNARILFMVSILSAIIITASGTFYILFQDTKQQTKDRNPQTFSYVEQAGGPQVLAPQRVRDVLQEEGESLLHEGSLAVTPLEQTFKLSHVAPLPAVLVSEKAVNAFSSQMDILVQVTVQAGEAVLITPFANIKEELYQPGTPVGLELGGKTVELRVKQEIKRAITNQLKPLGVLVVVDDADYISLTEALPPEKQLTYYGYELTNWTKSKDTIYRLITEVPEQSRGMFNERVSNYIRNKQFSSLTLFIGLFISFLFFISAGSMIYFKLFTELEEDQALFHALGRIGVSIRELMHSITLQIGVVFFVPVLVGGVHAAFAFKALKNVSGYNVWFYGFTVAGVYLLMQLVYFFIARHTYLRILVRK